MTGAPDPLYVAARRVLLDAIDALHDHLDALVLVGAQAVYVHAGEAEIAVAPFTTDGDVALDPRRLGAEPLLERALAGADFVSSSAVGHWERSVDVEGVPRIRIAHVHHEKHIHPARPATLPQLWWTVSYAPVVMPSARR